MEQYTNIHQGIIDRCKRGDTQAQFDLYKLYYKALYNTVLRIVNHTAEAEDIMQEAFLTAFDKLESYKGEVSFGAWLKRVAVNKSIDALKRRNRKPLEMLDDEAWDDVADDDVTANDNTREQNIKWEVEKIKQAVSQLKDGQRTVLTLHWFEGFDHDEIANIMNISAATSRSQLARAKQRVVNILSAAKNT